MSSSLLAGGDTKTTAATATTTRSLFALVLHAWNLCMLLVVTVALVLLSPAAFVILLPVACMAVSACLLCAIAARILLLPFFAPPADRAREHHRSGVRERRQDCIEVDRAEAPGASDEDASSAEEGHGGQEPNLGFSFSFSDEGLSNPCDWDDEHRRFYFVDTGSYCRTFYELLAFWRRMEEGKPATGGETNRKRSINMVKYMGHEVERAGPLEKETKICRP